MVEHSEEPSMIYVFTMFQTGKVVVGRSKKADLSILNETVSKRHCLISLNYKTNIFSLYDLNSKFGTLLKIKNVSICYNADNQEEHCDSVRQIRY